MKRGDFNNTMLRNLTVSTIRVLYKCHIYRAVLPTIAPLITEVTGT